MEREEMYGGVLAGNDPFGSLLPLCHISSSQEDRLRRCPFAPERYNPENNESSSSESIGGIPVASTGIVMVSLTESEEDEDNSNSRDVFHTPPEESAAQSSNEVRQTVEVDGRDGGRWSPHGRGETVAVGIESLDADGVGTVDLSRDTDLGFSDIQLTQRETADFGLNRLSLVVSVTESIGARVLPRELSLEDGLGESPLKKLKISEQNSDESDEESEPERAASPNHGFDSDENLEIDGDDAKSGGQSLAKRKLEFTDNDNSTEIVELGTEQNESVLEMRNAENNGRNEVNEQQSNGNENENVSSQEFVEAARQDRTGARRLTAAIQQEQLPPARRRLPNSLLGRSQNAADGNKGDREEEEEEEITMLDVLRLSKQDIVDDNISSCCILEICKRRGMNFPRPAWWPEEGSDMGDDDDLATENTGRVRRRRGW